MPRHLMDDLYPSRDECQRTVREMYRRRPMFVLPEHRAPPSSHTRLAQGVPFDILDSIRELDNKTNAMNNKRCQMEGEGPERGGKKAKGESKDELQESASEAEGKTPKEEKEERESQNEPAVKEEESQEEVIVKEEESQLMLDDIYTLSYELDE